MDLNAVLAEAVALGASDTHLKVGNPPTVRIFSKLYALEGAAPITRAEMDAVVDSLLDDHRREHFRKHMQVDLAYGSDDLGRFRVNVFLQRGVPSIALRTIPLHVRNVGELNLPPVIEKIALEERGLVLVTGTTGSGKSTTLAAMIRQINEGCTNHIITIEDPIEYTHQDVQSIVSQREIGYDCLTFAEGLRGALRQDPDVILVGEMRDLETIETAVLAAETGHLVMSTLHTLDASETITRVIAAFPEHYRDQARIVLSTVLKGIVSQRLVPRADGQGVVPAVEVLVTTARIAECIRVKEKTSEIRDAIGQGYTTYGMQTFDQSLLSLYRQGLITYDVALAQASNPSDFALKVRGVASTSDQRWSDFEKAPEVEEDSGTRLKIDRF
jgi:twitching motility protein PilT